MDITAQYDRSDFLGFLTTSFLPDDFETTEKKIPPEKPAFHIKNAVKLGICPSLDVSVYEFAHTSRYDPRVSLSREAFALLGRYDNTASNALAVFYNKDSETWRLSLIMSEYSLGAKKGQVKRGFSNPRRFSWLLGKDCKKHTPEAMLFTKGKVNSIEDLSSRFAIDVVTKKFYQELFDWYDKWAVNVVKFPVGEGAAAALPKTPDADANRQHLIRLITRMIFVWFLKQKNGLIPDWIFNKNSIDEVLKTFDPHSGKKGNYYNGIIQNLFFATLNKEITLRGFTEKDTRKDYGIKTVYRDHKDSPLFKITQEDFIKKFASVPFLNGGLFECLDRREGRERQKYVDGFSREKSRAAFVPNALFFGEASTDGSGGREGIIGLFNRYNFTVEENTPQDIDIALDPELLGKVFENLLGTYNDETKSTARNESGSFYTPREIVDYMVDTSLKEYFLSNEELGVRNKELEKKLDTLFSYHDTKHDFDSKQVRLLMDAISQCKILDPACGSGAFPMGVLNKLVFIMEKLDHDNKLWEEIQRHKAIKETEEAYRIGDREAREKRLKEISDVFESNRENYGRKLFLIENCIFGIDIQPIAIQISKLRFFISLIVDQKTGGTKENNYNVLPLPNLETKFVAANTLIGVKQEQGLLADPAIEQKQQELLVLRHKHFSARKADEKAVLREQDEALSKELIGLLKKDGFYNSADAEKMAAWNPYDQTKHCDFFDAYWMFGVKDGFDVVIGNPPYIQLQGNLADMYKNSGYESFSRSGDIYQLFYEFGYNQIQENGHFCFITSNKWMRTAYGEKTRAFFANKVNTKILIDFAGQRVFQSVTVDVNIIVVQKTINRQETLSCIIKEDCKDNMTDYIRQHGTRLEFPSGDSWVILNPIEKRIKEKIEQVGKPLKEWDISINYGIKTGCNEAFIIDKVKRDELIKKEPKSAEIIRPILRGRDIARYQVNFADLYLINVHNGISSKNIPPVDIKNYPAIKKHLDKYWDKIRDRDDQGITPYHLRSCAYMDDFSKQKLLWAETMRIHKSDIKNFPRFSFTENDIFTDKTCFFAVGKELLFILAYLNSSIGRYLCKRYVSILDNGGYLMQKVYLEQIPIARINPNIIREIEIISKKIVDGHRENIPLESKINNLIYSFLAFSSEEINYIKNDNLEVLSR